MQIFINNKPAVLKSGQSFEYVSENRLFTDSDSYTLTVVFPLRGCPQNIGIFGHIDRADVAAQKVVFDCELRDRNFTRFGSIVITEISESEVKTQFLEGRSEQNFDKTFDKVYINELAGLEWPDVSKDTFTPDKVWNPDLLGLTCVALPWVHDNTGNIQNKAVFNLLTFDPENPANYTYRFDWHEDVEGLSWQPYLLYLTKMICESADIGYAYDFTKWEESERLKYMLVCNSLPFAWDMHDFARALPHWTVEEYFRKLEQILGGEFEIDHRSKTVRFDFTSEIMSAKSDVCIENVVDEYSTEVKVEDARCEYKEAKNLFYRDCSHDTWKYYSCDWFLKDSGNLHKVYYNSLRELLEDNRMYYKWNDVKDPKSAIDRLMYAADCEAWFIIMPMSRHVVKIQNGVVAYEYICKLRPVNLFGGRIVDDDEDAPKEEIEFVPARIDDTDQTTGRLLFLDPSGYSEEEEVETAEESGDKEPPFRLSKTMATLKAGEKEKTAEYYDKIYIGWYDGVNYFREAPTILPDGSILSYYVQLPYPNAENIIIADDWSNFAYAHFSLRINDKDKGRGKITYKIDPKVKTTFKFLSDKIPDVRSVFHIRGRRYLCEKITATFNDDGMSQLMKGEFWPLL